MDLFPTFYLGYRSKPRLKDQEDEPRSRRVVERRGNVDLSRWLTDEIKEKMLKIDEPGETIEEIPFSEEDVLGENLEQDGTADSGQANRDSSRWTLSLAGRTIFPDVNRQLPSTRCLTFADCRLHLGLNTALVSLNFSQVCLNSSQVSLFTVSFREWKWECDIYSVKSLRSAVCSGLQSANVRHRLLHQWLVSLLNCS